MTTTFAAWLNPHYLCISIEEYEISGVVLKRKLESASLLDVDLSMQSTTCVWRYIYMTTRSFTTYNLCIYVAQFQSLGLSWSFITDRFRWMLMFKQAVIWEQLVLLKSPPNRFQELASRLIYFMFEMWQAVWEEITEFITNWYNNRHSYVAIQHKITLELTHVCSSKFTTICIWSFMENCVF